MILRNDCTKLEYAVRDQKSRSRLRLRARRRTRCHCLIQRYLTIIARGAIAPCRQADAMSQLVPGLNSYGPKQTFPTARHLLATRLRAHVRVQRHYRAGITDDASKVLAEKNATGNDVRSLRSRLLHARHGIRHERIVDVEIQIHSPLAFMETY